MDGDLAPLADLVALKERYGAALMIDEAHATGVLGARGAGLAEALGLTDRVEIHMGTFSKALGSLGGYVAGDRRLIDYLHNRARSFIYSTALAPPVLGAIEAALEIVAREPERRAYLLEESEKFRRGLRSAGLDTLGSETQIIPVLVGDNARTLEFAARFEQRGPDGGGPAAPHGAAGTGPGAVFPVRGPRPGGSGRALKTIVATARQMGLGR